MFFPSSDRAYCGSVFGLPTNLPTDLWITYVFLVYFHYDILHTVCEADSRQHQHTQAHVHTALSLSLFLCLSLASLVHIPFRVSYARNRSTNTRPEVFTTFVLIVKSGPVFGIFTRIFTFMTRRALSGGESSHSLTHSLPTLFVLNRIRSGKVRGSLVSGTEERSGPEGTRSHRLAVAGRYLIHNKLNSCF